MELKEYWGIIKRNKLVLVAVWGLIVLAPTLFFFGKSQQYQTVFSLNVGRRAVEKTSDYQYDQYYRLLADEKFSDVVLLWMKDPETVAEVLEKSGVSAKKLSLQELENFFQGKRLSASYSRVVFQGPSPELAKKMVENWQVVLDEKTDRMTGGQNQRGDLFAVRLGRPITDFYSPDYLLILLVAALAALPPAVFAAMAVDYFKKENADRN